LTCGNNFIGRFEKRHIALAVISIVYVTLTIFIVAYTVISVSFAPPSTSPVTKISDDDDEDEDEDEDDDTNLVAAVAQAQDQKSIVPLDQIVSGGPPPDGIPSIDNPKFVSVQEAEEFLDDSDLIVGRTLMEISELILSRY
jgi:hypothetical protein